MDVIGYNWSRESKTYSIAGGVANAGTWRKVRMVLLRTERTVSTSALSADTPHPNPGQDDTASGPIYSSSVTRDTVTGRNVKTNVVRAGISPEGWVVEGWTPA